MLQCRCAGGGSPIAVDLDFRVPTGLAARPKHSLRVEFHRNLAVAVDRHHASFALQSGELAVHDLAHGGLKITLPKAHASADIVSHGGADEDFAVSGGRHRTRPISGIPSCSNDR